VQGRLVGPWVNELRTTWKRAHRSEDKRACIIDLNDVTSIDKSGETTAAGYVPKKGAQLMARGLYVKHVLEQLKTGRSEYDELFRRSNSKRRRSNDYSSYASFRFGFKGPSGGTRATCATAFNNAERCFFWAALLEMPTTKSVRRRPSRMGRRDRFARCDSRRADYRAVVHNGDDPTGQFKKHSLGGAAGCAAPASAKQVGPWLRT